MDWIRTHVTQALARLPEYLQLPRIRAFIRVAALQAQLLEDALQGLQEGWYFDNAVGAQLDGIGDLLAEPRGVLGDVDYKLRLRARVRILNGGGTPDDLLTLLALLNPTLRARLQEQYPQGVELYVSGGALPQPSTQVGLLRDARPAGRRLLLGYQAWPDTQAFRFARGAFLSTGVAAGQGSLSMTSTAGFPATGSLVLDDGTPDREVLAYSAKFPNVLVLAAGVQTAKAHALNAAVEPYRLADSGGGLPVATTLLAPRSPGFAYLSVKDSSRFSVGDTLVLDEGLPNREVVVVLALPGGLIQVAPLTLAHEIRASVMLLVEPANATPTVPGLLSYVL